MDRSRLVALQTLDRVWPDHRTDPAYLLQILIMAGIPASEIHAVLDQRLEGVRADFRTRLEAGSYSSAVTDEIERQVRRRLRLDTACAGEIRRMEKECAANIRIALQEAFDTARIRKGLEGAR